MIGKLKELTMNRDGTYNLTVTVSSDFREMFDELFDKLVEVTIRKYAKHRSLAANRYAWTLIDQITERLQQKEPRAGWKPEIVYRNAIREIGGVSTIIGLRKDAIETFKRNWEKDSIGRQVEVLDGSGKEGWANVRIYFGSSEFNTEQMSRLIDSLIQDAESLGIPTITPAEMQRMIGQYSKNRIGA